MTPLKTRSLSLAFGVFSAAGHRPPRPAAARVRDRVDRAAEPFDAFRRAAVAGGGRRGGGRGRGGDAGVDRPRLGGGGARGGSVERRSSGSSWSLRWRCRACTSTRKTCTSAATGSTWRRSGPPASGPSASGASAPGRSSRTFGARASTWSSRTRSARPATPTRSAARTSPAPPAPRGDLGPFFEEYLVPGAKAFVPRRWPTAEQAIELIRAAGGARRRRPPLLGPLGVGRGRPPDPQPRARRGRDLLPDALARADRPPARPLRGARPGAHRLLRLPRPEPQDLRPLRRLRHLRARRAPDTAQGLELQPGRFAAPGRRSQRGPNRRSAMAEAGVPTDPSSRLPHLSQPSLDACHVAAYGP